MKDTEIFEIFKAKKAAPDISLYTDDLLGPSLSIAAPKIPDSIKMLNGKKKIAALAEPKKETPKKVMKLITKSTAAPEENEEENEEGELVSDREPIIKSTKAEEDEEVEAPRLSNREQAIQIGLNHDAKQSVKSFNEFKKVNVGDIPRIVKKGMHDTTHITPQYQQLKDLPDEVRTPIQAMAGTLFDRISSHDMNSVQVIANLPNYRINSIEEFDATKKWIKSHGLANDELIKPLRNHIGNIDLISTEGITHLIVDNHDGHFIFSWPSIENHL